MPETKSIMDMEEDERQEYIEWGAQTLVRRGLDSVEDAELEQWGIAMRAEVAQLEAERERLREALTEQISELRGYAYRGRCDGVPDDIRRAFIALGTPCDDIDKAALGGE